MLLHEISINTGKGKKKYIYIWASLVAQLVKNPPAMQEPQFDSWVGKIRWRRGEATHSSILAWRTPWAV